MPQTGRRRGRHNGSGFLYAIGGGNETDKVLASVECIPTGRHAHRSGGKVPFLTNDWHPVAPMMVSRCLFGATLHGSRSTIVAGGAPNPFSRSEAAEIFLRLEENGDGQWTSLAPMADAIYAHRLFAVSGGYMHVGTSRMTHYRVYQTLKEI